MSCVGIDIETTGLDPDKNLVWEIGAVRLGRTGIHAFYASIPIPPPPDHVWGQWAWENYSTPVTRLHDLEDGKAGLILMDYSHLLSVASVLDKLAQWVGGEDTLVAHYADFERSFLGEELKARGLGDERWRCSKVRFRQHLPSSPSAALSAALAELRLPPLRLPHRALHDALGCLRLWMALEEMEAIERREAQWEVSSLGKEVGQ